MENYYFSFDTYVVRLSSPPPTESMSFQLTGNIQGVTRIQYDTNLLNFDVKPFKVKVDWGDGPYYIDDVYKADPRIDPLSTFSPLLTTFLSYTIHPESVAPYVKSLELTVFYENGVVHEFITDITVNADNLIDHDIFVTDVQNTNAKENVIYNIESQKGALFVVTNNQEAG